MPVVDTTPPTVARPNAWVAWSRSPHRQPPWARADLFRGSTRVPRIDDRSRTTPPSFVPNPGTLCEPPRIDRSAPVSPAKRTTGMTSAWSEGRTIAFGRLSIIPL